MLCGLLLGATTLNYLDRQTLSILAPAIQREMHLDNRALGLLFSLFYYAYTFAQFGIGSILDRTNLRWAFASAVFGWSLAAGFTALTTGFLSLLCFRLLLGVAESANWPAALRIVARALPPHERSLGTGIFTSGTSIGALIAPSLILGLSSSFGWRFAFAGVASLALIWLLFWIVYTKDQQFDPVWREPAPLQQNSKGVYRALLGSPRFWRAFALSILVNPILYFNLNWLPTYFSQQRGLEGSKDAGLALTCIYLGLDLGYLVCGLAVRVLSRHSPVPVARRRVFLLATVLLLASAAAPLASGNVLAIALLSVANFAVGVWITMYLTMAQEVSPAHVSTAAGLLGGCGSLAGALLMWAVGGITQYTRSFNLPLMAVAGMGVAAAVVGVFITADDSRVLRQPAQIDDGVGAGWSREGSNAGGSAA